MNAATFFSFPRLPAALIPIYGTTFVDLLGYTLMIPLLPGLAERYGASDITVGSLLSISALCSAVAAPVWGKLSDRLGRKSILLISQALTLVGYLMLAFSHALPTLFMSRILSGCGAGNVSAAQSYIADVTTAEQRNQAFAFYGVIFGAGFVVGPVASGFIAREGIAVPFFLAAALEIANLLLTSIFLPWRPPAHQSRTSALDTLRAGLRPPILRVFVRQFLFIFAVVYFLGSFALYVHHQFGYGPSRVSWLLALAGAVGGLVQALFVSPFARRFGDRLVAQAGLGTLAIAYGMLFFTTSIGVFAAMLCIWAAGAALVAPTLMSLLASRAPKADRGAIMGFGDSINNAALILAPLAGAAIAGFDTRLMGCIPLLSVLVALWIGQTPLQYRKQATEKASSY